MSQPFSDQELATWNQSRGRQIEEKAIKWESAAIEYIELLQDELARSSSFLHVHGWTVPDEKVQRGKELRDLLGIKGSGE